ncbi:protein of unknown function [Hyphomicrobium sp. MC1]|nr:protein of unknown function [Hyphomicrobium sp. MC1]
MLAMTVYSTVQPRVITRSRWAHLAATDAAVPSVFFFVSMVG